MRAFIQKQENEWLNENCYSSYVGFSRMGYKIIPFTVKDIDIVKPEEDDVVHGGIIAIRKIIDKLKLKQPEIHHPHRHLIKYTKRIFKEKYLKDILYKYNNGLNQNILLIKTKKSM